MSLTAIDVASSSTYYLETGEVHGDIVTPIIGDLAIYTYAAAGEFIGKEYSYSGSAWFERTQITDASDGSAAGLVVIGEPASFDGLPAIAPTIASVATAEVSIEATGAEIIMLRATINAPDDSTANNRLLSKNPDCIIIVQGETITVSSSIAMTRIDLVGVGSALDAATHVIAHDEATLSNVAAAVLKFEFDSADIVYKADITMSDVWNSGAEAQVKVGGYSYV